MLKKVDENANMGATNNNSSRMAALQERKKQIEETLAKRNQELRELCLQEVEITGITPPEMPLEVGETPPTLRRVVGTTFQLPENLVQNSSNKDEMIQSLELQIQLHANLAEAALGLANEHHLSKTIKRQRRNEYQKHKNLCIELQEKLALLKEKQLTEQPKQKKKPRSEEITKQHTNDVTTTLSNNNNDPHFNTDVRHSLRHIKTSESNSHTVDYYRHSQDYRRYPRPHSELPYPTQQRYDDIFSGIYSLSLNGYSRYMERHENFGTGSSNYNTNVYQYNTGYDQFQPATSYYVPQYSSQHSPQMSHPKSYHQAHNIPTQNFYVQQKSPQHHSPHQSKYFDYTNDYNKYGNISPQKTYYAHSVHSAMDYKQGYHTDGSMMNPHQIQPHQQYEHTNQITSGLGGCWKKNERGELVWSTNEANWQRDKRFGSLDRRKNKKITKMQANAENKSATLGGIPSIQVQTSNNVPVNTVQAVSRRSVDRQLVRTQSLGSVGAQTLDSVYPSDDNSSCGSENRNRTMSYSLQKPKAKEWVETALDSPISSKSSTKPQPIPSSKPLPIPPSALSPEDKYFVNNNISIVSHTPPTVPSPVVAKLPLEIPAESNPCVRSPETKKEFFNSPIDNENFTIVQAGICKPYHEETKPFEMSDFYKYSTKYKKTLKQENAFDHDKEGNINTEKPSDQNMNHTYGPKRIFDDNHSGTNINSNFDSQNNHMQTDLNRWYETRGINNTVSRPNGRISDTLV